LDIWLELHEIKPFLPLAEKLDVSPVARGYDDFGNPGFLLQYQEVKGIPENLDHRFYSENQTWAERRDGFVKRHMAQVKKKKEPLWTPEGDPTRRHLALIVWAYTPTLKRLKQWIKNNS
jgi:hypothetical protein